MNAIISQKENLIKLRPIEGIKCFACNPANPVGLKMKFFADETHVYSWLTVADHFCSWDTYVHGGILATILDEIMSWAVLYFSKKLILTKSINVNFIKTVYTETEIKAVGRIYKRLNERKVIMEGTIYNSNNDLCTKSTGEYVLIDSSAINISSYK